MPTAMVQTEEQKQYGGSTIPESLRNHPGLHSEEDAIALPENQPTKAKTKKEWADQQEMELEKQEVQVADSQSLALIKANLVE